MNRFLPLFVLAAALGCGGSTTQVTAPVAEAIVPAFDARVHMPDNTWGVLRANGKAITSSPYYATLLEMVVNAAPLGEGQGREEALTSLLPNTDTMHIAFEVNRTGIGSVILEGDYAAGQVESVFKKMATAPTETKIGGLRALTSGEATIVEVGSGKWLYTNTANAAGLIARTTPPALFSDARFQSVSQAVDFNNGTIRFAGLANQRIRDLIVKTRVISVEQASKVEGIGVSFEWSDGTQLAIVLDSVDEAGAQSIATIITQTVDRYKSNLMVKMSGLDGVLGSITSQQTGNRVRTELNMDDAMTRDVLQKGGGLFQLLMQ